MTTIRSHGLCQGCRAKELGRSSTFKRTKKKKTGLPDFYKEMLDVLRESGMSWTGRPISIPTVCNVCHILPKRWYKSVAEDKDNIVFLTDGEHDDFDRYLDTLDFENLEKQFGKVWERAVRMVLQMEKEGKIKEKGRLLNEILERYGKQNGKTSPDCCSGYLSNRERMEYPRWLDVLD